MGGGVPHCHVSFLWRVEQGQGRAAAQGSVPCCKPPSEAPWTAQSGSHERHELQRARLLENKTLRLGRVEKGRGKEVLKGGVRCERDLASVTEWKDSASLRRERCGRGGEGEGERVWRGIHLRSTSCGPEHWQHRGDMIARHSL